MKTELLKEIRKYIDGDMYHCFYDSKRIAIEDTDSKMLKELFPMYKKEPDFLFGLYNSLRFFDEINYDNLLTYLENIQRIFKFNKSYYEPNEKYYGEIPSDRNFWSNYIISIVPAKDLRKDGNYVALSRLEDYEIENPSKLCLNGLFNSADKETTQTLLDKKLMFNPTSKLEIDNLS